MSAFVPEFVNPENAFTHLAYVLLISSMMMTSLRWMPIWQLVGVCAKGDFLGEISPVSGNRASASVVIAISMQIAALDRKCLDEIAQQLPVIGTAISDALNRELAAKPVRINRAASGISAQA